MMKKFVSLLLAGAMVFSAACVPAFAASVETIELDDEEETEEGGQEEGGEDLTA